MRYYAVWIYTSVIFALRFYTSVGDILTRKDVNYSTDIATETDDRLLLFSTLDGTLVAIDQQTGNVQWKSKDKPTVTVPLDVTDAIVPLFLPDPRDGSLYLLGDGKELLKKLPFTIPQLVASSPCRSSDGILYTGKKKDTWFVLDPKTGQKQQILGFEKSPTCPIGNSNGVYVGRTQYSIMMIDSRNPHRKWNVTFYDYTASPMDKDELQNYDLAHFASTSTGRIVAMDRRRGAMLWDIDLGSPVVSVYILDAEGLLTLPFTSMANHTIAHLATQLLTHQQPFPYQPTHMKLYPTVYIGQHMYGLYALPSLVDQNMVTITSSEVGPLLLEGPDAVKCPQPYPVYAFPGRNYHIPEGGDSRDSVTFQSISTVNYTIIYLGHYNIPDYTSGRLLISGQSVFNTKLITDESVETQEAPETKEENIEGVEKEAVTIGEQVDSIEDVDTSTITMLSRKIIEVTFGTFRDIKRWINQQDNKGLKLTLIILIGCIIAMFWYLQMQVREFQLSQNGSRGKYGSSVGRNGPITALAEELPNGTVQVGKITFNPEQLLGKGCEGTFVYRGEFDKRQVAVKRLLPECFTFADREVALLRESDAHPNVIRYFCTEQDRMFRYIALELCQFTVHDYITGKCDIGIISSLSILKQATAGLAHLHSLDIVHRDIKPHNVLLSMPNSKGTVRAMISDFGLCKKLQVGRVSFSHRSGITGTDGWIAPEMLSGNERTTCAVDMFSLGCLFYYVLSEGDHPFGDVLRRQANILGDDSNLENLKGPSWHVALQKPLLASLISPRPQDRPPCTAALMHPMFWSSANVLAFFQDVSDRIEKADVDDVVLKTLEQGATFVVRRDWHRHIHVEIATDLRKYRSYRGDSIRDLLRALRNKKHHYRDLTPEAQKLLGETADSFTDYWTSRFPLLLIHTWLSMQIVADETTFVNYYHYNHRYSLCNYKDKEGLLYTIYKDDFGEADLDDLPERILTYNKATQKPMSVDQYFRKYKQNSNNYTRNYGSQLYVEENVGDYNLNNVGLYRNNPKFAQNRSPKYKKRYNGSVTYADTCAGDIKSINSDNNEAAVAAHHVHFPNNDWEVGVKHRYSAKNRKSNKITDEPPKWVIMPDKKKI